MKRQQSQENLQIGLYVHPWHESRRGILAGIAAFGRSRPRWAFYTPTPSLPDWRKLPPAPEKLDGVIFFTGSHLDPPVDFAAGLPRIVIGNAHPGHFDLSWDNRAVGRTAAEHLIEQGHRSLACIHFEGRAYQEERAAGFSETASEHGLIYTDVVVNPEEMDAQLQEAMNRLDRPTGLMLATDTLAHRVLAVANQLRMDVPEHLAVVGVGDDPLFCELSTPPLSSVALPGEQLGYQAAELLERLLTGQPHPSEPVLVAPGYVAVRQSSDMLAIDHPAVVRALRLIRQRANEGITINEVHDAVPLSRRALEIQFKKVVGRTIREEIWRVRIDQAKRLLSETELPLDAVAMRAGFDNAQRLSAVFARQTGEPPTAYRRRKHLPQR